MAAGRQRGPVLVLVGLAALTAGKPLCPVAREFLNPTYHTPPSGSVLPVEGCTTVYWVIDGEPPPPALALLTRSVGSVLRHRNARAGEKLCLFVIVHYAKEPAPASRLAVCNELGAAAAAAAAGCHETVATRVHRACAVVPRAFPSVAGAEIHAIHAIGEWLRHPLILELSALSRRFVELEQTRRMGNVDKIRMDLVRVGAQLWVRIFAYQLLMPHGAPRAIFLDTDTVVQSSLRPLFRTPLGGSFFVAYAQHCMTDPAFHSDHYNMRSNALRGFGFTSQRAQSVNNGVFVMDFRLACRGRIHQPLFRLLRLVSREGRVLFNNSAALFDQPVQVVGWAHNSTYVDARWNCRRLVHMYPTCHVVHDKEYHAVPGASPLCTSCELAGGGA